MLKAPQPRRYTSRLVLATNGVGRIYSLTEIGICGE